MPPFRHRDDNTQEFLEAQSRGHHRLKVGDVGIFPFDAPGYLCRNATRGLRPVRRNQEIKRLIRMLRKGNPYVTKNRRVLQLATIVGGTEKDKLDQRARNWNRHCSAHGETAHLRHS